MHERKAAFVLSDFPQPAAIPAIKLKLIKILSRHGHGSDSSVLVGHHPDRGSLEINVMPQLNALDQSSWLEISIGVNQLHPPHQRPFRVRGKLRNGQVQLQYIHRFIGAHPGKSVRVVNPQMIRPPEGSQASEIILVRGPSARHAEMNRKSGTPA